MTQHATNERRVSSRVVVALDLHLTRAVGNAVTARTLDLSVGGARVLSNRPLRVDEELQFRLDLPAAGRHLDGTARVLRQHRHDTYALRFEHTPPAVLRDLGAFVAANGAAPVG
ncbi:MAG: PilZ protein [Solirubrobacterales bacterium]|nr:PilZ protein [Solirubrobacterales bacterium]